MIARAPHPRYVVPSGYRPAEEWRQIDAADGSARGEACRYDKPHAPWARVALIRPATGGGWSWEVDRIARGHKAPVARGSGVYPLPEMARPFADLAARS